MKLLAFIAFLAFGAVAHADTPTATPTWTPTATPTDSPTLTATRTASPTATPTRTPEPIQNIYVNCDSQYAVVTLDLGNCENTVIKGQMTLGTDYIEIGGYQYPLAYIRRFKCVPGGSN